MDERIILLVAEFNTEILEPMVATAIDEIRVRQAKLVATASVPGCYELPLLARTAFSRPDCDIVVALGYIERGETLHGEVMGHAVCRALLDQSLSVGKPLGLGIIGPGATREQAIARTERCAREAVAAAIASLDAQAALRSSSPPPGRLR